MSKLYAKIFEAKKEFTAIVKDDTNPFYKSKYFDINTLLSQVEPILEKNGLMVLQPIKDNKVQTVIIDVESGEKEVSEIELPNLTDPQKLGSAITYYRRYTLQSILSLQAEDDDGNKAVKKPKQKDERKPNLAQTGFDYLMKQGKESEITEALAERRMGAQQREQLTNKLNNLNNQ